jgi:ETFB lysine methyltransferase
MTRLACEADLRAVFERLPGPLPGPAAPLRLLRPPSVDELLDRLDPDDPEAEERIPYWAEHWPSADALLRWLAAGRAPQRPGRALELGSGLGSVGMAALRMGWNIQLSDRDPEALDLLRINLARNGLDPRRALQLDWRDPPPACFDTILAADILYERSFGEQVARFLTRALAPGGRAFIAEPRRPVAETAIDIFARSFRMRILPLRARVDERWRPVRLLELRAPRN